MAWIWSENKIGDWAASALGGNSRLLPSGKLKPLSTRRARGAVGLLSAETGSGPRWLLVAGRLAGVRVNGHAIPLGICCLSDRDEIFLQGRRFFYSEERLATIEPLPADSSASCPRCKQPLTQGPAVKCPVCGVWSHEDPDAGLGCWTYGESCAACHSQATALDSTFTWTPEIL